MKIITNYYQHPFIIAKISGWLCEVQFIVYTLASLYVLFQYRKPIKEYYSNMDKVNLSWLNFVLVGFIIWRLAFMSLRFSNLPDSLIYAQLFSIIVELGFLFFASALVYKGLTTPMIFIDQHVRQKYQTSRLSDSDKECFLQKIETCMRKEKPYLDPLFALGDLSKRTGIPINYVSQIMNEKLNKNFYDYVNYYRIEETKQNLSDPFYLNKTITEIFYDAGFNSKSVFNTAFKKYVGKTPREYRADFQKNH